MRTLAEPSTDWAAWLAASSETVVAPVEAVERPAPTSRACVWAAERGDRSELEFERHRTDSLALLACFFD